LERPGLGYAPEKSGNIATTNELNRHLHGLPAARGEDLLYQVLDEHLQTFLAACDEDGVRVPRL
jgi:hypothetical protein